MEGLTAAERAEYQRVGKLQQPVPLPLARAALSRRVVVCLLPLLVLPGIVTRRVFLHNLFLQLAQPWLPLVTPYQLPPAAAALVAEGECTWELSTPATVCVADREADSPNMDMYGDSSGPHPERACLSRAHAHVCTAGTTRALLIGPLTSLPGRWHSFSAPYGSLIPSAHRLTAVTCDAVNDTTGAALPYPPLHIHHIHIARGDSVHWHETHGDYELGHDGYTRRIPPGYCEVSDGAADTKVSSKCYVESRLASLAQ